MNLYESIKSNHLNEAQLNEHLDSELLETEITQDELQTCLHNTAKEVFPSDYELTINGPTVRIDHKGEYYKLLGILRDNTEFNIGLFLPNNYIMGGKYIQLEGKSFEDVQTEIKELITKLFNIIKQDEEFNDIDASILDSEKQETNYRYQVREYDGPGAEYGVYDTKDKKFVQKGTKKVMQAACNDLNKKNETEDLKEANEPRSVQEIITIVTDRLNQMDELWKTLQKNPSDLAPVDDLAKLIRLNYPNMSEQDITKWILKQLKIN